MLTRHFLPWKIKDPYHIAQMERNLDRDILTKLQAWKLNPARKPLILEGARQVGKTTVLQRFGDEAFTRKVYLNFERDENLAAYFEKSLDPKTLIQTLSLHSGVEIEPNNTLIIFDEVQECPRALNSLKYFCEEAREYHLAAAGSLLGVKTIHTQGFPVGKVNFMHMFPLTFFEFLQSLGEIKLREYLESYPNFEPLPVPLHDKLITYLKEYFFIGGMPEAVATYIATHNHGSVREIQWEILDAYQRDFAKHAPDNQIMKITTIWDQIHRQLARENKKFIFSAIRKSARGRDYEEAIQWLWEAGIIYKSLHVSTPNLPIDSYADQHIFKIFMLDVGLLGAKSNLAAKTIIEGNHMFKEFKGALTENFVAQEFMAQGDKTLYYWTSAGTAEVDFLRGSKQLIYPLEVKAGQIAKKKSLLSYGSKFPDAILSRATAMNLKHDGAIYNYPLYLVGRFPGIMEF